MVTVPQIFNGGQMTDLPEFSGTFDGTELFEVVAPGNAEEGTNQTVTSAQLAALLSNPTITTVITNGQYTSPGSPYVVPAGVSRVYVNKSATESTYIQFGLAASYATEPLVREVAGNNGNTITVTMTGGETADGNASVPISSGYSGYFFRPISSLNTWTLGAG